MQNASLFPSTHDLVLIGGGHTHALVLRQWAMKPVAGVRLTLIDPNPKAPYSGMLPGHVAGHYGREDLNIDLVRLARFAGARLILGAADGIDLERRVVTVAGRPDVAFDFASVDVGITSAMPSLPGFSEHAVPAKPLGPFARDWQAYLEGDGPAHVAVIGGGVAGVELAMAMAHALQAKQRKATVRLVDRGEALTAVIPSSARILRREMERLGVELVEHTDIQAITSEGLETSTGVISADFVTGAAGAMAYPWLAETGLTTDNGFLTVSETLQTSDPAVFAVGDCAHLAFDPRPKAGVYAVRQAPVLAHNLRALAMGQSLKRYRPQKDYLKLISLGDKRALGERFGLPFHGRTMWRLKDRIDQSFMDKFRDLPAMAPPALPADHTAEVAKAVAGKPLCGGCGAKVGRNALAEVTRGFEDAAQIGAHHVSHDHLRAFWDDPVVMTRVAAHHALGDIWATGGDVAGALVALTLPRASETLTERMLAEVMATARGIFAEHGAEVLGGHTSMGAEMTIGFTVFGENGRVGLSGAQAGDALLLTKPLGSGVIMAAEMAKSAPGDVVEHALAAMQRGQGAAAAHLGLVAHAMTDVTGFGLIGHLTGICDASGTGAEIMLEDVPLLPGALELSRAGQASSIYPQNRMLAPDVADDGKAALLFDPQTSGGLLAAVPQDAVANVLKAMQADGLEVWQIGQISAEAGLRVK